MVRHVSLRSRLSRPANNIVCCRNKQLVRQKLYGMVPATRLGKRRHPLNDRTLPALLFLFTSGDPMQRRHFLKQIAVATAFAVAQLGVGAQAQAADTIKVGVLHSLSGTMAIS